MADTTKVKEEKAEGKSPAKTAAASPPAAEHTAFSETQPTVDPAIEPANAPGSEDEFDVVDGYDGQSLSGSTSATSSIYAHTYEHGRRYHVFKNGRYPIPNDDQEQNREDMKHAMLLELNDGALFFAPIGDNPQLIVDIGTGTGVWAIDVGDRYPSARVRGIDLTPIQPVWVPPNVDFLVDDCENEWLQHDVDLVHFRYMASILKNPQKVLKNAYDAIKPGGWIEFQEANGDPRCDDGTMPDDDPVATIYDYARRGFAKFGMDATLGSKMGPLLTEAGFVDVRCRVKKVPIGPWAKDKTLRLIGQYQKLTLLDFLPVLGGRPCEALGMSAAEGQVAAALARRALDEPNVHRYFNYYFWYAQKPITSESRPGPAAE